jgi:hypothetical protein
MGRIRRVNTKKRLAKHLGRVLSFLRKEDLSDIRSKLLYKSHKDEITRER